MENQASASSRALTQFEQEFLKFMPAENLGQPKTIADVIAQKIREKRDQLNAQFQQPDPVSNIDPAVTDLYKQIGGVLAHYTSGKIPKGFKTLPALSNWEQLIMITRPEKWTSAAMYEATKLFAANLKEKQAQRFFACILLPRIRDDIAERHKLNVHLFKALAKTLYKPGAFFKGIVLPLCEAGDCTNREASIVCSVIIRHHIPLLHACAAMLRLAEMQYNPINSVFLNALIQKRYALPFRVVDALTFHFINIGGLKREEELPLLWHRCLHSLVDFYGKDMAPEQKEMLEETLKANWHATISPKVRELLRSNERNELIQCETLVSGDLVDGEFVESDQEMDQEMDV